MCRQVEERREKKEMEKRQKSGGRRKKIKRKEREESDGCWEEKVLLKKKKKKGYGVAVWHCFTFFLLCLIFAMKVLCQIYIAGYRLKLSESKLSNFLKVKNLNYGLSIKIVGVKLNLKATLVF